jgi:hypothetical protein
VADKSDHQQKIRTFMDLLPLTMGIAGLSRAEAGRHLTEDQMESRALSIKHAYDVARRTVREIIES